MRVKTPLGPRELVGNAWARRAQGWCCSTARSWGFGGRYGNKLGEKIYFPFVCSHLLLRLHCLVWCSKKGAGQSGATAMLPALGAEMAQPRRKRGCEGRCFGQLALPRSSVPANYSSQLRNASPGCCGCPQTSPCCLHGPARLRPRVVAASSRHLPVPINWEHELVFLIHVSLILFVLNLIRRDDLIR